jgi:surface protein
MKNIIFTLALLISFIGFSQTQITDANFNQAIETCLSTNPIDGMCSDSEYGAMPDWDVSQVTDMSYAFYNRPDFSADINSWDVSNVTKLIAMFQSATSFNQPIGDWDVSSVTDIGSMFAAATSFNQPIGSWDVSSVNDMNDVFSYASSFNQPIGDWDVSNVNNMRYMFSDASSFNQPIGAWDVSSVNNMDSMFLDTPAFNQDLSNWCVTNISSEPTEFSTDSALIESNKPIWGTCSSFGLDDQNQLDISIYPNPVIDKLFIQGLSNPTKISVYDILGKLVLSKTTSSEINVDNLQSGIYIIKIVDEQKEIIRKFIKN